MFYETYISMESELMNISSANLKTELEKAGLALSLVRQIADRLTEKAHLHYQPVKEGYHYYHQVQYRVMVYLLYFDWLVDYLNGSNDELQQCMVNILPNGTYDRWKKARQEAEKMREEYLKMLVEG